MKLRHLILLAVAILAICEIQTLEYNERYIIEEKAR